MQVRCLKLESGFTRSIGEGFDFSVIEVTTAVENHSADVRTLGALCEELANLLSPFDIGSDLLEALVHGGRGNEGRAGGVVDDLGVDVLVRIMNGEARAFGSAADLAADALVNALADRLAFDCAHVAKKGWCYLPTLLPSLRRTYSLT